MRCKLQRTNLVLKSLLLGYMFIGLECRSPDPTFPNVILVMTDDQGWGDLSIHGNKNLQTPHIDQIALEGVRFESFFVSSVCSPTRAELFTGRHHVRMGVSSTSSGGERIDLDETLMSELFQEAGYKTAAYGKWHNGMQAPYHPNARGFDDFYGFCSGHWGHYFSPMLEHNGKIVKGNGYLIDDFTDHALAFMEENQDRPFFLYLPYNTPHRPMQVPERWWQKFVHKHITQFASDSSKEKMLHTKAALAMCENIDWNVGRILSKINELKITHNTIIIFLSDNGPNGHRWNGGMKGIKGSTDEGGVRSPLFVKWEGTIPPGKKIVEITSVRDILPTLIEISGIVSKPTKPLDGISLVPLIFEENPDWEQRFLINHWKGKTSIRSQTHRLDHEGWLFNMESDIGQTRNIAADNPELVSHFEDVRRKWLNEVMPEFKAMESLPFTIGHPDFLFTQLPARDATAYGNIQRSNRSPNCSFFTNWRNLEDKITWNVEVLEAGHYEVEMYYSCPEDDIGSGVELSVGNHNIVGKITEAHDPPLKGMHEDRFPRGNSYIKEFKAIKLGVIHLDKGRGILALQALEIPGLQVMDFRLLMLEKLN